MDGGGLEVDTVDRPTEDEFDIAGRLGGVEEDRVQSGAPDRVDHLVGLRSVGLEHRVGVVDGVHHPAAHRDGDLVDAVDDTDVDEWDDAAGGEGEVDGPPGVHLAHPEIGSALVDGDRVAGATEVGGEERSGGTTTGDDDRSPHRVTSSRMPTKRSMSSKEL